MKKKLKVSEREHPGKVLLRERGCIIERSGFVIRLEFDREYQTDDVYEYLTRVMQEQKYSGA